MRTILEDALTDILPHGSGIDDKWQFELAVRKGEPVILACNSFHCMNEGGYYDGWADFTLTIPRTMLDFTLVFNGRSAQYKARKYGLRECLSDTFAEALRDELIY